MLLLWHIIIIIINAVVVIESENEESVQKAAFSKVKSDLLGLRRQINQVCLRIGLLSEISRGGFSLGRFLSA